MASASVKGLGFGLIGFGAFCSRGLGWAENFGVRGISRRGWW